MVFCKIPPNGQTWDKTTKTFVPHTEVVGTAGATSITGSSFPITGGSTSVTGGSTSLTGGSNSLTGGSTSLTGGSTSALIGSKRIQLTSEQAKNYRVGQKIMIRNDKGEKELRTIIGVVN